MVGPFHRDLNLLEQGCKETLNACGPSYRHTGYCCSVQACCTDVSVYTPTSIIRTEETLDNRRTSANRHISECGSLYRYIGAWFLSKPVKNFKYSRTQLIGTLVIRIGLFHEYIGREFYKTNLSWHYRLSDQVQYSVMASSTSNQ